MTFFEAPDLPPDPPEYQQPEWIGPANNILGVAVPLRIVLARNDQVALAITDASAFPNGVELNLALRLRNLSGEARRALMHGGPFDFHRFAGEPITGGIPAEILRFGVEFADGRKATTLDNRHWRSEAGPPGPVLVQRGGGGERAWDMRFWLWPLPPSGVLAFVAEWPLGGIALTRVEVDADPIVKAAAEAETLWPDGEPTSGGGWAAQFVVSANDSGAVEDASPNPDEP